MEDSEINHLGPPQNLKKSQDKRITVLLDFVHFISVLFQTKTFRKLVLLLQVADGRTTLYSFVFPDGVSLNVGPINTLRQWIKSNRKVIHIASPYRQKTLNFTTARIIGRDSNPGSREYEAEMLTTFSNVLRPVYITRIPCSTFEEYVLILRHLQTRYSVSQSVSQSVVWLKVKYLRGRSALGAGIQIRW